MEDQVEEGVTGKGVKMDDEAVEPHARELLREGEGEGDEGRSESERDSEGGSRRPVQEWHRK